MKKINLILITLSLFFFIATANVYCNQASEALNGEWLTEDKGATITISKSGDVWNGAISWLKEPLETDKKSPAFGKDPIDFRNPDKSKQTRKIMGLMMLENFKWTGKKFESGTIYDPDSGKTYKCNITFKGEDSIKVRGYIGISLLGETQIWTRKQ